MPTDEWPRIAVLGAGAVGCYFGGMLARASAPVTLIGRAPHVDAILRDGLFLDSQSFQGRVSVSASTEVSALRSEEIVLFCVKTPDTEEAATSLAPHLSRDAVLVSLQNGVDNVDRIRSAARIDAIPAVVYVAAEMTGPGRVKHNGRGDLAIGFFSTNAGVHRKGDLENLAAMFTRASIPCRVSENIQADLWTKLIINCAYNAISALARARYGRIVENAFTRHVMIQVVEEALAVARAAGVTFGNVNHVDAVLRLVETMGGAMSSTAQDIARGKRTEIDALNGYVVRRGADLGVATPVNQTLHALVKLLEESAQGT